MPDLRSASSEVSVDLGEEPGEHNEVEIETSGERTSGDRCRLKEATPAENGEC